MALTWTAYLLLPLAYINVFIVESRIISAIIASIALIALWHVFWIIHGKGLIDKIKTGLNNLQNFSREDVACLKITLPVQPIEDCTAWDETDKDTEAKDTIGLVKFPDDGWEIHFNEGAYTPYDDRQKMAMRAAYERDKAAGWFEDICVDLPDDACIDLAARGTELIIPLRGKS